MCISKKISTENRKVINRLCITIRISKGVDSWKARVRIEQITGGVDKSEIGSVVILRFIGPG